MSMQVVVLAGGLGTRLRPWTNSIPKPLIPLLDKTLVEQVVARLPEGLIDEVVIAAGYKVQEMRDHFAKADIDHEVTIIPEDEPLGTGGALRNCRDAIDGTFACFNGDVISSLDMGEMLVQHQEKKVMGTLGLWEVDDPTRFGIVGLDDENMITRFKEKPMPEEVFSNLINAGSYILEEDIFELMPEGRFSLEREVFPQLAEARSLGGMPFEGYFLDAGTPESWRAATERAIDTGRFTNGRVIDGSWSASGIIPDCMLGGFNAFHAGVEMGGGCVVSESTLLSDSRIGDGSSLDRCLIGQGATIGAGCTLSEVMVDHGSVVPEGTLQSGGVWPPSD